MKAKLKSLRRLKREFGIERVEVSNGRNSGYKIIHSGANLFINDAMLGMFGDGKYYEFEPVSNYPFTHKTFYGSRNWNFHKTWFDHVEYLSEDDFEL